MERSSWPAVLEDETLSDAELDASLELWSGLHSELLYQTRPSAGAELTIRRGSGQASAVFGHIILDFIPVKDAPDQWRVQARRWMKADEAQAFDQAFPQGRIRELTTTWPMDSGWAIEAALEQAQVKSKVPIIEYETTSARCPAVVQAVAEFERLLRLPFSVSRPRTGDSIILHGSSIRIETSGHFGPRPTEFAGMVTRLEFTADSGPFSRWGRDTIARLTPCLGMPSEDE